MGSLKMGQQGAVLRGEIVARNQQEALLVRREKMQKDFSRWISVYSPLPTPDFVRLLRKKDLGRPVALGAHHAEGGRLGLFLWVSKKISLPGSRGEEEGSGQSGWQAVLLPEG